MDYNDKLTLAKKALESGFYDKRTIELIFPELKKSEVEKIKSDIQYAVRCTYGDKSEQTNKILAWLEKQSEQKFRGKSCWLFQRFRWLSLMYIRYCWNK